MNTLTQIRGLSQRTKLLLATNAVNSFGGGLVLPFLWIYLSQVRHLPLWVPAATLAIQAASAVVAGLAWGPVLDRLPYRMVVLIVMTVAGVGTGLYAVATNGPLALLAAVVYGIGISGVGSVIRSIYATVTAPSQRSLTYSLDFGIFNAMTGLGVLVGGLVAASDLPSAAGRYAALYLMDGLTFLLAGLVTASLLPGGRTGTGESAGGEPSAEPAGESEAAGQASSEPASRAGYRSLLANRSVTAVIGTMLVCSLLSYGQMRSGLPGYLTLDHALSARGFSFTFALDVVVSVAAQAALLPLLGRVRRTRLVAASGLLWAFSWAFILVAGRLHGGPALALALVGVALIAVGTVFVIPTLTALLNDLAEPRLRGRANAAFSTSISGGAVLGPVLAGATLPWWHGVPLILALILGSLLLAVVVFRLGRLLPAAADRDPGPAPATAPEPAGTADLAGTAGSAETAQPAGTAEPAAAAESAGTADLAGGTGSAETAQPAGTAELPATGSRPDTELSAQV